MPATLWHVAVMLLARWGGLLAYCWHVASTLLPCLLAHCFHIAPTLLPRCGGLLPCLLAHCFHIASTLWRVCNPPPSVAGSVTRELERGVVVRVTNPLPYAGGLQTRLNVADTWQASVYTWGGTAPFSLRFSPLHSSFFTLHSSFFTLHSPLFTFHSSLFILHSSLFILHSSLFTLHSSLFSLLRIFS